MKTNYDFGGVLTALGVDAKVLNTLDKKMLDEQGFLIFSNLIEPKWLKKLKETFEEASQSLKSNIDNQSLAKTGTRHLPDLIDLGQTIERIYTHPKILAATHHILKRSFKLSGLHGRDPLPGFGQQGLHTDWIPRQPNEPFQVVTSIWMLDDFKLESGPTRVVPATHLITDKLNKKVSDPNYNHPGQIFVKATEGSVLVFNGHLWHSGTCNNSKNHRRAIICSFTASENRIFSSPIPSNLENLSPAVLQLLNI